MAHPDPLASSGQRLRAALLVVGLIGVLPGLAGAQDGLSRDEARQKLDQTEKSLKSNRAKEEDLSQELVALAEERARLNKELIEAGKRVQASEASLTKTEAKLTELTEQVNVIQSSIAERKEALVKMLSAMQRIGRTPPPALVTRRDDALAVVRSAMLLADVFPELKYEADNLSRELDGLVTLERGIREQRDAEKTETERLAAERETLDGLLEEKRRATAQGEAELAETKRVASEQAQAVTDLNELLVRLDANIAKVEIAQYDAEIAAERALRTRQRQQALATPENENVVEIKPRSAKIAFASPDRLQPALPFEAVKGSLRLPAQGRRVKRFGDADAGGSTLKGISLQTREEARITAPADGWVVYSGPFRSYGQLLIINAGGGYHILLAGMSRIDVSLGQFVLAGEPVAEMGNTETDSQGKKSSRPVLYVEFRKDGRPIDPDPWWAQASEKVQG
jgi:septal ring factor EnvC (AmiA/AmiB activator)